MSNSFRSKRVLHDTRSKTNQIETHSKNCQKYENITAVVDILHLKIVPLLWSLIGLGLITAIIVVALICGNIDILLGLIPVVLAMGDGKAVFDKIPFFNNLPKSTTAVYKKIEPFPLQEKNVSSPVIDRIKTPTNRRKKTSQTSGSE